MFYTDTRKSYSSVGVLFSVIPFLCWYQKNKWPLKQLSKIINSNILRREKLKFRYEIIPKMFSKNRRKAHSIFEKFSISRVTLSKVSAYNIFLNSTHTTFSHELFIKIARWQVNDSITGRTKRNSRIDFDNKISSSMNSLLCFWWFNNHFIRIWNALYWDLSL